jgi:hypothetical protein
VIATFGDSASRWYGLSARLLGWRPDDFWIATPAELAMALADPTDPASLSPPSREMIAKLMERDANGH